MKKNLTLIFVLILATSAFVYSDDFATVAKKHYIGKPVIAKMPVPDDKSVMLVYPQRENQFDMELYRLKMERVGVGLEAGDVAIIKNVTVDGNDVTFHLIGTGDALPEGKIPPEMLDKDIWGRGSSKIRIKAGDLLAKSKNKITTLNELLSIVCETKALVTDDDLSPEIRKAIAAKVIDAGMPKKAVYLILGDPTEIIKEIKGDLLVEAWVYEKEDFSSLVIFFHDGRVHLIKEM